MHCQIETALSLSFDLKDRAEVDEYDIPGMTKIAQNMQAEIDANRIFIDQYITKEKTMLKDLAELQTKIELQENKLKKNAVKYLYTLC